jgi:uncharacterized protein YprB with RNaseH-like and TPR domain
VCPKGRRRSPGGPKRPKIAGRYQAILSIAAFDLETTNLNADYGILMAAVVRTNYSKKPIIFRGDETNPKWKTKRSDDSEIVRAVSEELQKHDILVAHNGATGGWGFDIPFLQTRLAKWNLPPFPRKKLIDPVQIARKQFRLSSNSLASVAGHLGLENKMYLAPDVWTQAALDGDKKAMDQIVARCSSDVRILVCIVAHIKSYCATLDHRGSSW